MELILYKRVIYFDYAVAPLYVCVFMCHRHFDTRLLLLAPENYALFFSNCNMCQNEMEKESESVLNYSSLVLLLLLLFK